MNIEIKLKEILKNTGNNLKFYRDSIYELKNKINNHLNDILVYIDNNYTLAEEYKAGRISKKEKDEQVKSNNIECDYCVKKTKESFFSLKEAIMYFNDTVLNLNVGSDVIPHEILDLLNEITIEGTTYKTIQVISKFSETKFRICFLLNYPELTIDVPPLVAEEVKGKVERIVSDVENLSYTVIPKSEDNIYNLIVTLDIEIEEEL